MNQSKNEMSSFLAELACEATQKLEVQRANQQDRQSMTKSVNAALERAYRFFHLFAKHLNALEPEVPRIYVLDGKNQFSKMQWKSGMTEYRKQSLADNALMDHVYFQVRLTIPESITITRRWEQFDETKKDLGAYGLKTVEDMHELWKNRSQKVNFQVNLEPEFVVRMRFEGNYDDGTVDFESNNLDGFGVLSGKLNPELLQSNIFDGIGRFLMGRSNALPQELELVRDFSRNR